MSSPAVIGEELAGPRVSEQRVVFSVPDPDRVLSGVRLVPALSTTKPLDFRRTRTGWALNFARPPVQRMEYKLRLSHATGGDHDTVDPTNPLTAPGAFGDKSVIVFPGYVEPSWLSAPTVAGDHTTLSVPAQGLGGSVDVLLWSPEGSPPEEPMPLLVAHDGPEYERMAGLTRFVGALIKTEHVRAFRVALVAPRSRNEWYSAKNAYARALVDDVLPQIAGLVTVQGPVVGMGASLGAVAMLHAHRLYPSAFGGLFLQSGSFFDSRLDPQESDFARFVRLTRFVVATRRPAADPHPIPVVLTCGAAEENLGNNRQMTGALLAQGYPARLVEVPDAHNFIAWRDALDPSLTGLLTTVWPPR
ncbi:MAG: alpha/beta hydrolase-fold protein [Actinomycetota bacterium]|nr:alpha/beta hydrolase-fold protein [Actinomycetota bacterium]